MQNGNYKILVFDIVITGHHSEYIGHLVDYLYSKKEKRSYYFFVVHSDFSEKFPEIASRAKEISNVTWQEIRPKELAKVSGGNLNTSWQSYRILDRYAKKFQVDHVSALDFHTLKYGAIFFRPRYTLSGILFVQFYRLAQDSLRQTWTYGKRYLLSKLQSFNSEITRIFVLNDQGTVDYMNGEFDTEVFRMLPDPIPTNEPLADFDIYEHFGIDKMRKIFLHIGSLGHRKGTFEVVDAAQQVKGEMQEEICILLAGRASHAEEEDIIANKVDTQNKNSRVQVIWENRFVPTPMMQSLFDQCHCVLLPYKNAEYSSGILGHAAAAGKMVIATGAGLLKEMVLNNDLGLLVDPPQAQQIAEKMEESLTFTGTLGANKKFVESHSPEMFAKLILEPENLVG